MGRFRDASDDDGGETGIDMSPLIDCVFILLIFFIVTTVFVEEVGVEVDKPQAASASDLEKNSIIVAITADNKVIYGGKELGISGVGARVRALLNRDELPVIVQPDSASPSGILVKVIDAAKLGGAKKVSLATQK